jgi:hypothetical protein
MLFYENSATVRLVIYISEATGMVSEATGRQDVATGTAADRTVCQGKATVALPGATAPRNGATAVLARPAAPESPGRGGPAGHGGIEIPI